jgi:16S rRNA G527 N7-methylase RsmG
LRTPSSKDKILADAEKRVSALNKNYQRGKITDVERYNTVVDQWTQARELITNQMMEELKNDVRNGEVYLNPIYLMYEYPRGLYLEHDRYLYVNVGVGMVGVPIRLVRPEISLFTLASGPAALPA